MGLINYSAILNPSLGEADVVETAASLALVTHQPGFSRLPAPIQSVINHYKNCWEAWPFDNEFHSEAALTRFIHHQIDMGLRKNRKGIEMLMRRCPEHPSFASRAAAAADPGTRKEWNRLHRDYQLEYEGECGVGVFQLPYWIEFDRFRELLYVSDVQGGSLHALSPDGKDAGCIADNLEKPLGFLIENENDILICNHQGGQIICVGPTGSKRIMMDFRTNSASFDPYVYPIFIQRIKQSYFLLLSTQNIRNRKLFMIEGEKITELPTEGMYINCMRVFEEELYINDMYSGRLLKYNCQHSRFTYTTIMPILGAYYSFCMHADACYHLYNSHFMAILKTTLGARTVFRSINCVRHKVPNAQIHSIQTFETSGRRRLLLSDVLRKSVHFISI
jgi:hypothetical protein